MSHTIRSRHRLMAGLAISAALALPAGASADTFSVVNDGVGLSGTAVATTSPDGAHLFDAPLDSTNSVALMPSDLGLAPTDEIDALSFGLDGADPYDIYFSVARGSQGAAGSGVATRAATNQQANALYHTTSQLLGHNSVDTGGSAYGLKDSPHSQLNDDLDAVDLDAAPFDPGVDGNVYFSLAGDGNIYLNSKNNVFLTASDLGLFQGEDVDAIAVDEWSGAVLFSTATAGSAADLFLSTGNGYHSLAFSAADLGLLASDNLNALTTTAAVPEPASAALVASALLGLLALRRREPEPSRRAARRRLARGLTVALCCLLAVSLATNAEARRRHRRRSRAGELRVPKKQYLIFTNYELGMHCTGFDFSYCCVLPPFNSIQAQAVKTGVEPKQLTPEDGIKLGYEFADNSTSDPSRLIYWGVPYDVGDGTEKWADGSPDGNPDGDTTDPEDTLANVEFDSLYTYNPFTGMAGSEGAVPGNPPILGFLEGGKSPGATASDRISVGGATLNIPINNGPTFAPMANPTADPNVDTLAGLGLGRPGLTYVGKEGTVVYTYTKMINEAGAPLGLDGKRLVDVPVVLTTADVWDAVGLPLTPFNDSLLASKPVEQITESDFKPFQEQWVYMYNAETGKQVLQRDGTPVAFFGTGPIDAPQCEKCHGYNEQLGDVPAGDPTGHAKEEYDYWIAQGSSVYFARVKSAAMSILGIHDEDFGTNFLANYDPAGSNNSRLGRQSVFCQSCHADNIVGRFQAGDRFCDNVFPSVPANGQASRYPGSRNNVGNQALTYAIHMRHSGAIERTLPDDNGRPGNCQACHPAKAQGMANPLFPIADDGSLTPVAQADIRDTRGCYTQRDAHANRDRNADMGASDTPSHLNAIGEWYDTHVAEDLDANGKEKGIYCSNCHNRLSNELWKADQGIGDPIPGSLKRPATSTLRDSDIPTIAAALGLTVDELTAKYMDPKLRTPETDPNLNPGDGNAGGDLFSFGPDAPFVGKANGQWCRMCHGDPGDGGGSSVNCSFCHDDGRTSDAPDLQGKSAEELLVAVQYAVENGTMKGFANEEEGAGWADLTEQDFIDMAAYLGGEQVIDDTNDVYQYKGMGGDVIPGVPYGVVTDGSDFWTAAGEPHCADCHAYPYVESQGGINAPWAEPGKYALFRHSKGHMRLACQSCHESIHGLYPTTDHDPTTRNAALQYNPDGSHGPVTCAACHVTNSAGVPTVAERKRVDTDGDGRPDTVIGNNYDLAVTYMHTVREGTSVLPTVERNPLSTAYGATMIPEGPSYNDCANTNVGQQDGEPAYSPGPANDQK